MNSQDDDIQDAETLAELGGGLELMEALLDNEELQVIAARNDSRPVLREWFSDRGPDAWQHDADHSGRIGTTGSVGVAWSYDGTHDKVDPSTGLSTFNGLVVTGRDVTVRAITIFDLEGDELRAHRYVDWIGLYAQLGLGVNWRVPVPPPRPGSSH